MPSEPVSAARASVVSATETAAPTRIVRGLYDIGHRSILRDLPCLNGIVVVAGMKPAYVDELRPCRLCVPGLVDGAALQLGWSAIPIPGQAKARQAFGQNGLLKASFCPAPATVCGNVDPRDPPAAGPRHAADFVESLLAQKLAAGRKSDD